MNRLLLLVLISTPVGCGFSNSSPKVPTASASTPTNSRDSMLHTDFPTVEGEYQLTNEWSVILPGKFKRRLKDGDLIIWRPRLTIIVAIWNNDKHESKNERLAWIKEGISKEAFDLQVDNDEAILRFSYRLTEKRDDGLVHALYAFAIGQESHVQAAIYFDDESGVDLARSICRSFSEHTPHDAQR